MSEMQTTVLGVPGRMKKEEWSSGGLFMHQFFLASRPTKGIAETLTLELRFDDNSRDGHQRFYITGEVTVPNRRDIERGGCLHEEISEVFPEFAHLIKWHMCSTDGPMRYVKNTVYLAGDRDYRGLRKGERRQRTNENGVPLWELPRSESVTRASHQKPIDVKTLTWQPVEIVGEGKERELDAARRAAVWPDATDEELTQEPEVLKAALLARLPKLIAEFRADMEALGFEWRVNA